MSKKKRRTKPTRVDVSFFTDDLLDEYNKLPDNDPLKKKIDRVVSRLRENPTFGQPIAKQLIPKIYVKERTLHNLHWVELSRAKGWRLLYTLGVSKDAKTARIVEWFTRHKDYERRFGYG